MRSPPSSSRRSSGRKTPMSIRWSYSARVQRRVRIASASMRATLRQMAGDVNACDSGRRTAPALAATLGLALDRSAGLGPAVEADREVGDVRESHLAEHVGRQGRALAARTIYDDPLRRIDLARVIVRGRVEPELEHAARYVRRAGNEPELAPLADVANVHDLDVAAGYLHLELLDGQILDPLLRFLDHLADGLPGLPRGHGHVPQGWMVAPEPTSGKPMGAVKRPRSRRARSVSP